MALSTTDTLTVTLSGAAGTVTIKRYGDGSFEITDKDSKVTKHNGNEAASLKVLLDAMNGDTTFTGA